MRRATTQVLASVLVGCALFAGSGSLLAEAVLQPSAGPALELFGVGSTTSADECGGIVYLLLGRCEVLPQGSAA